MLKTLIKTEENKPWNPWTLFSNKTAEGEYASPPSCSIPDAPKPVNSWIFHTFQPPALRFWILSWARAGNRSRNCCLSFQSFFHTSFQFLQRLFAFKVLDAFLDPVQFLFKLVSVELQAFLFLFCSKKAAKRWTAPATPAGATSQSRVSRNFSWLTHVVSPPFRVKSALPPIRQRFKHCPVLKSKQLHNRTSLSSPKRSVLCFMVVLLL
jgi:hypothetical protein